MSQYFVSVDAIALVAATAKSIFELATPASGRARIKYVNVMFDGVVSANVPVKIEWGKFSAAVTTASAVTPSKQDPSTVPSLATTKHSTTAEGAGTASDVHIWRISPTAGVIYQIPLGDEFAVLLSTFFRVRCTAAQAVNVAFDIGWEE